MYAVHVSRPDCAQAVHALSRHLHAPTEASLKLSRQVVSYLLGTADIGLTYDGIKPTPLHGYSDADWAGDLTTRRSTSGFVFMRNNAAIAWQSVLQRTVAHSTSDAEYRALSESGREALFLRSLEASVTGCTHLDPTVLFEDNRGAAKWSGDAANHSKTKHVEICYHSIREQVNELKNLAVRYCKTASMLADPMTKSLPVPQFRKLFRKIFGSEKSTGTIGPDDSPEQGG